MDTSGRAREAELSGDSNAWAGQHVPFLELLGIRLVQATADGAELEMIVDERHLRTLGLLHGGVTATLLDTAMGLAAMRRAPQSQHAVTMQLNVNYIRPAWKGERLVATSLLTHVGRQTSVARGEVRTGNAELVAQGTATFLFVPRP